MTLPGSDAAAWLRSAISYQIERGDVMSEDNGFVERPVKYAVRRGANQQLGEKMVRLVATLDNGKAVPWARSSIGGQHFAQLKRRGLRACIARQPDGTYLAWCERIDPVKAP